MTQIARNLTDDVDGFFREKRYLIHDRDPLYTKDFLSMLAERGIESVKLPPRSPNLNAFAERFVRSIKEGCLERMIFFGEDALRNAVFEFVAHYHLERNHQGLGNRLIVRWRRRLKVESNGVSRWLVELLLSTSGVNHQYTQHAQSGEATKCRVADMSSRNSRGALPRGIGVAQEPILHKRHPRSL